METTASFEACSAPLPYSTDVPTPTMARDEIQLKVKSTAVNHLDLVKASGVARQILRVRGTRSVGTEHGITWRPCRNVTANLFDDP